MTKIEILKASKCLGKEHKAFSNIVSKAYEITEETDKDYKKRSSWYWEKVVPGVLNGTRDIFLAEFNGEVAGCAILKKEEGENKICTLFVSDKYRNMGIATRLLEESFKYLYSMAKSRNISPEGISFWAYFYNFSILIPNIPYFFCSSGV